MSGEPAWLTAADAVLCHEHVLATFGGAPGVRDFARLEAAIGRARNVWAYESKDLSVLAATYAHGIAKNHPFVDGNKRVAFVLTRVFLGLNGVAFNPPEPEAVVMVEALASGELTPEDYAAWVRKHSGRARRRRRET